MSNEFYTHTGWPATSGSGQSVDARAELNALQAAFDKLPTMASNANKLVVVNSSGLALTTMGSGQANSALTSWTPTLTASTPGDLAITYAEQTGQQYRLGGIVVTYFRIRTSAWTHTTASGPLILGGIPSTAIALSRATSAIDYSGFTKAGYHNMIVEFNSNASQAFFNVGGSGVAYAQLAVTDFPTGGIVVIAGTVVQGG